jgi:hypothetical protein
MTVHRTIDDKNVIAFHFQKKFQWRHLLNGLENRRSNQGWTRKKMYRKTFLENKSDANWEVYRKQLNLVTKIKKNSIKTYFDERTAGGPKSSTFYSTIKPFLSNKGIKSSNNIILYENEKIVNDPKEVSEIFNNFFYKC